MKKIFITNILLLLTTNILLSLHIVGGTITYEALGNDEYQFTLQVYRDCQAVTGAPLDDPAAITIYNGANLVSSLSVSLTSDQLISVIQNPVCSLDGVCLQLGIYEFNATLPYHIDGYSVVYQRCCRTTILSNLVAPGTQGMTFEAYLGPQVLSMSNQSPEFLENIPTSINANEPFIYNAGALDADGDSLSYELMIPYLGASASLPAPMPASAPPYSLVNFASGISLNNLLGPGGIPISIDPITGIMEATPANSGLYLVGYRVKEYRNGSFMGETRREFILYIDSGASGFSIEGTVKIDSTTLLDDGIVTLLEEDFILDSLFVIDTQGVTSPNSFEFTNLLNGRYHLKAEPAPTSIFYNDYLPTYYGGSAIWNTGLVLDVCQVSQLNTEIILIPTANLGGNGRISGHIQNAAGFTPAKNLDLVLINNYGDPLAHTRTDQSGNFSFPNLTIGNYRIYIDLVNSAIDNSQTPIINVPLFNPIQDDMLFTLHPTYLELVENTVSIEAPSPNLQYSILPNPNRGSFSVDLFFEGSQEVKFSLFNTLGSNVLFQEMFATNTLSAQIDTKLPAGIYFLKVEMEGTSKTKKIIIQ